MLDFISIPLVVGICVAGVYGLFELFARRRERLMIIEKMGDRIDSSSIKLGLPSFLPRFSFSALKGGCLLTGIGLGLLVGFIINTAFWSSGIYNSSNFDGHYDHVQRSLPEIAYGASVLLFGGLSLIVAFLIELKMSKKEDK